MSSKLQCKICGVEIDPKEVSDEVDGQAFEDQSICEDCNWEDPKGENHNREESKLEDSLESSQFEVSEQKKEDEEMTLMEVIGGFIFISIIIGLGIGMIVEPQASANQPISGRGITLLIKFVVKWIWSYPVGIILIIIGGVICILFVMTIVSQLISKFKKR